MEGQKMKILVTGANGYIGHHVVQRLIKLNHEVIAVDFNNSRIVSEANFLNYDILNTSFNDVDLYKKLKSPDHIIHLAWQDGFNHFSDAHMDNLMKHFHFIKNLIDHGCQSLSIMGTVHEIGFWEGRVNENTPCNPLSYYGIAKNSLRQLVMLYIKNKAISLKWLRAFYITGDDKNNHSVFTKILEKAQAGEKEFPFTNGTNQFDFIDVETLAMQICAAAIQTEIDGIINVCSGKPQSIKDKAEEFIKENAFNINLKLGAFSTRPYDSSVIYGDNSKILKILKNEISTGV